MCLLMGGLCLLLLMTGSGERVASSNECQLPHHSANSHALLFTDTDDEQR
jgi:hypothetical protein